MAYDFKKLSEVESIKTVSDEANVLVEDGGIIKRTPKSQIGTVKTVNGVEPDVDGNVEITVDGENVITQDKLDAALADLKDEIPTHDWESLDGKPFGEVSSKKESIFINASNVSNYGLIDAPWGRVNVGDTVKVLFDDTEYNTVVRYDVSASQKYIGNGGLVNGEETGEPFFFRESGDVSFEDGNSHNLEITYEELVEEIKIINSKYLSPTVPVIPTANVGDVVKVKAVDENGVPTEWEAVEMPNTNGFLSNEPLWSASPLNDDYTWNQDILDQAYEYNYRKGYNLVLISEYYDEEWGGWSTDYHYYIIMYDTNIDGYQLTCKDLYGNEEIFQTADNNAPWQDGEHRVTFKVYRPIKKELLVNPHSGTVPEPTGEYVTATEYKKLLTALGNNGFIFIE